MAKKRIGLSLSFGIGGAWIFALLLVFMARKYHVLLTHDLLIDSILITNMISIGISLFAFSRYTLLKERLLQFIALAFFVGGLIKLLGVVISDIGLFPPGQQAFYFQLANWQGGDFLFALMLAVGTVMVWIFPEFKSTLLDVLGSIVTAVIIIFIVVIVSRIGYFGNQLFTGNFRPMAMSVSILFLISFIGVARNHLKYPTLFNYAISITLFLLIFACFVRAFSTSITDTASAASTGLTVFAYFLGAIGSLIDVGQIFNEYVGSTESLNAANRELLKYQLYLEKIPDPVRILDDEDKTLYVNPAFEQDFGYSLSEIKGKTFQDLFGSNEREKVEEYTRLVNGGRGSEFELTVVTKSGQKIDALLNSSRIIIEGKRSGRITIFRNITKRKQLERHDRILSTAVENTNEAIALTDHEGKITFLNSAAEKLFGYKLAEVQEKNLWEIVSPVLGLDENPIKRAAYDGVNVRGFEFAIQRHGMTRVLSVSASPLMDPGGEVSGAVAIFNDITERRASEERIAYQAMLLSEVNDAIIASDRNGKIASWNPAAERLYGWKAEEVIGRPFYEVVQFGFRGITRERLEAELEKKNFWRGEGVNYSKDRRELNIDSSIAMVRDANGNSTGTVSINRDITEQKRNEIAIRKQNRRLYVINRTALAVKDVLDVPGILTSSLTRLLEFEDASAAAVYLLHISESNRSEEDHGSSTPKLELAASLGFSPTFEKNPRAQILHLPESQSDSAAANLFAEVVKSGEAQIIPDMVSSRDPLGQFANLREVLAEEMVSSAVVAPIVGTRNVHGVLLVTAKKKIAFTTSDKELFAMISRIMGAAVENALLYNDVVEKSEELEDSNEQLIMSKMWVEEANAQLVQANQQLEDTSRLKSQFLANMSHELRTPLNSIIGFTNLILTDDVQPPTGEQKEGLEIVLRNAKNLLALINDILDLSKIEAGRMTISPEEFDVQTVVKDALATVEPLLGDKPVKLISEMAPDVPSLFSDSARIKQIVLNLLSNAVKFTDKGYIKVIIKMIGNDFVSLDVEDTGAGIPPDYLDVVFEEFRQVDGSNTRKHGGTGLGLAISRKLARMLGGDLNVRSEIGNGSTFTLTVPVVYKKPEAAIKKPEAGSQPGKSEIQVPESERPNPESGNLVVCVDDDQEVLLLLKNHLVSEGFEFYGVSDSRNAVEAIRQYKPILVTLDIMMPNKDGWQILQEMKSDPDIKNIPVVIHSVVDNKALAMSLGAESFLIKPVERDRLISVVRNFTGTGGGEILVVDDNDDFTNFLRNILEKSNFTIHTARNGVEAMNALLEKPAGGNQTVPSLVFLDLLMPEMDGFEVVEKMYEDDRLKEVPIVVLTAKEVTDEDQAALDDKIKNIVRKEGLSREIILREVNKFIQRKRKDNKT